MKKEQYEKLLNILTSTGADFAEIYFEDEHNKVYEYTDSKLDALKSGNSRGIGFRIIYDNDYYYSSTNKLDMTNLELTAKRLAENINSKKRDKTVNLSELEDKTTKVIIPHNEFPIEKKKNLLARLDRKIRETYKEITQVTLVLIENNKTIFIANSDGKFIKTNATRTRYICHTYAEKGEIKEDESFAFGSRKGYEFLDDIEIEKETLETAASSVEKLSAKDFKGGEMPVVIGPGFGAVIFHEACGHGLEGTSVEPKLSIFSDQLNKQVGTKKVTLIDDGTIENAWGSSIVDDEGNPTEKNILIDKGILKKYLIDTYSGIKMHQKSNGCGRRESYEYAPTSRMSNTYLAPGNDKFEDMIKSISYGIYCKRLSGGQVNTTTGDFNFVVTQAYVIRKGEIAERIKGVTLIGNGKDILNKVEMVGDDLKLAEGYCGSKSGMIYVTCGQPSIKISKILVGGKE